MTQHIDINGYWDIYVAYNVVFNKMNTGFTYTDTNKRTSCVIIGQASSYEQFLNTVVHEAKHVQTSICEYYDVDEKSEDTAYLIGYIVMHMTKCFNGKDCFI